MNETSSSYYPKLSRYERRQLAKAKKAAARKKLMREAFPG
jgi:hypothetical protein